MKITAASVQASGQRVVEVVKRSDAAKGFVILPKRWKVEQTIGALTTLRRLEQGWADVFTRGHPGRRGAEGTADVDGKLVHHIEIGHVFQNLDDARSQIALKADKHRQ